MATSKYVVLISHVVFYWVGGLVIFVGASVITGPLFVCLPAGPLCVYNMAGVCICGLHPHLNLVA